VLAAIKETIWRWFDRIVHELMADDLASSIRQSGHALAMIEELSSQLAAAREEAATRQKVMRDELMESEARMMTLIEELQERESEPETDTLTNETNKSGHMRWTERKRARAIAESNPAELARRIIPNGNVQGNVRGRNDGPGDGKTSPSA
jgi:hypothetical protein